METPVAYIKREIATHYFRLFHSISELKTTNRTSSPFLPHLLDLFEPLRHELGVGVCEVGVPVRLGGVTLLEVLQQPSLEPRVLPLVGQKYLGVRRLVVERLRRNRHQ